MTLRQMEYLIAVVDTGSFSRAAEFLNVSQPGLSQQIQQLEREVGAALLERLPRKAELTAAGRAYLPEARRAVQASANAKRAARNLMEGAGGDLEIATVLTVAAGVLPRSIALWQRERRDVTIRMFEYAHRAHLEREFADGVADIAVGPRPGSWAGPIVSLGSEEFVVVLSEDDPLLASGEAIDVTLLADRNWVLFDRRNGLSEITEQVCRESGFTPNGALETTQVAAGVRLAAAGLGPILVPDNAVPPGLEGSVVHLKSPYRRELCVYARTSFSPVAKAYVDVLVASRQLWQA